MTDEKLRALERRHLQNPVPPPLRLTEYLRAGRFDDAATLAREVINAGDYCPEAVQALKRRPLACTGLIAIDPTSCGNTHVFLPGREPKTLDTSHGILGGKIADVAYVNGSLYALINDQHRQTQQLLEISPDGETIRTPQPERLEGIIGVRDASELATTHRVSETHTAIRNYGIALDLTTMEGSIFAWNGSWFFSEHSIGQNLFFLAHHTDIEGRHGAITTHCAHIENGVTYLRQEEQSPMRWFIHGSHSRGNPRSRLIGSVQCNQISTIVIVPETSRFVRGENYVTRGDDLAIVRGRNGAIQKEIPASALNGLLLAHYKGYAQ